MVGVGPEWIHTRAYGVTTNSLGGEAALDLCSGLREAQIRLVPRTGYEYNFGEGMSARLASAAAFDRDPMSMPRRLIHQRPPRRRQPEITRQLAHTLTARSL